MHALSLQLHASIKTSIFLDQIEVNKDQYLAIHVTKPNTKYKRSKVTGNKIKGGGRLTPQWGASCPSGGHLTPLSKILYFPNFIRLNTRQAVVNR